MTHELLSGFIEVGIAGPQLAMPMTTYQLLQLQFRRVPVYVAGLYLVCTLSLFLGSCDESARKGRIKLEHHLPPQLNSWQRQPGVAIFNRETIFDYIDGAGEVYNSYAFQEVALARYTQDNQPEVTVELFDMGVPEDAYGVFSYAREQEESGIGGGYELRGGVLCFWQARFYACVTIERSDEQSGELLKSIAGALSDFLPRPSIRPPLVDALPSEGMSLSSVRYFHNQQSLNYHYYLARENILNLDSTTSVVLARYQAASASLILIAYRDVTTASTALASFRSDYLSASDTNFPVEIKPGKFASCVQVNKYVAVVLDAPSPHVADSLLDASRASLSRLN
ncbi:MAG: DUF6599 family protein [Candidatus Zixiibacteriota bacterium]